MDLLVPRSERDFVYEYARRAPLALALERALECRLLAAHPLCRPVLDIGCGDGLFAEILYGPHALIEYGLDIDPQESARAAARGAYRTVFTGSATAIPLPDESVSSVLSNSTLEHILPLDAVLDEIARVLRHGGEAYITVPTHRFDRYAVIYRLLDAVRLHALAERFRCFYDRFWRHHHFYAPDEWRARLEERGLAVSEVVEYDTALRCAVHDALVPLAFPAFLLRKVIGRYVVLPAVRGAVARLVRRALPADRVDPLPPGSGGLVMLRATKP